MKKLWFVLLVAGVLTGCSKEEGAENGNGSNGTLPALPALPDPNDVCSAMDDIDFMAYCYDRYDVNKDGKVSVLEAEAVREMGGTQFLCVSSLKGIERFPNLEDLDVTIGVNSDIDLDYGSVLQYNKKLKKISLHYSHSLSVLDFGSFGELERVNLNMFNFRYDGRLGTMVLPKTIQSVGLYYASIENLKCYAVTPPELSLYDSYISAIYVPKEQVAVYKATDTWKQFNIQPL